MQVTRLQEIGGLALISVPTLPSSRELSAMIISIVSVNDLHRTLTTEVFALGAWEEKMKALGPSSGGITQQMLHTAVKRSHERSMRKEWNLRGLQFPTATQVLFFLQRTSQSGSY